MVAKVLVALLLVFAAPAVSIVSAAEPARAEPARPLNERVTNGPVTGEPDNAAGKGLDPLGPAQPEGLAPAAPQPGGRPAECRGLPRDARQACEAGSSRMQQDAPVPGGSGNQGASGRGAGDR